MKEENQLPHERLIAWQVARTARVTAMQFTQTLPPGHGRERTQINDAAASVVRNICEGASRWKPKEKIHKFEIAGAEAAEAAGAIQSLLDLKQGDEALGLRFIESARRVAALLRGLIRRQHTRMDSR